MEEQIKERLMQYADTIDTYVQKTANLASEEVPKVIHEMLQYSAFEYGVKALFWSAIAAVSIYCIKKIYDVLSKEDSVYDMNDTEIAFPLILSVTCVILSVIFTINCVLVLGKIYFAPRLYLIEYLRDLF